MSLFHSKLQRVKWMDGVCNCVCHLEVVYCGDSVNSTTLTWILISVLYTITSQNLHLMLFFPRSVDAKLHKEQNLSRREQRRRSKCCSFFFSFSFLLWCFDIWTARTTELLPMWHFSPVFLRNKRLADDFFFPIQNKYIMRNISWRRYKGGSANCLSFARWCKESLEWFQERVLFLW